MNMKTQGGIYEIVNTKNGKRYIGSSVNTAVRWRSHRHQLITGKHHSPKLQAAWNKNGEAAFNFRVMLVCQRSQLLFQEQRCIHGFRPEYNIYMVAGSPRRTEWTDDRRAAQSVAMRGNNYALGVRFSFESRAKLSAAHLGKKFTPEHLSNHTKAKIGRKKSPCSAEAKANMSMARMGNKNALGYKHTAKARANMAASRIGKKRGPYKTHLAVKREMGIKLKRRGRKS